jgi:hypothetical protein
MDQQVIVRAINRTYGLRPAQPLGEPETAITFSRWNGHITTAEGNYYSNGGYLVMGGNVRSLPEEVR